MSNELSPARGFDVPDAMRSRAVSVVAKLLENSSPKIQVQACRLVISMVETTQRASAMATSTQNLQVTIDVAKRDVERNPLAITVDGQGQHFAADFDRTADRLPIESENR